jgi:hypothetical protein
MISFCLVSWLPFLRKAGQGAKAWERATAGVFEEMAHA